MNTPTPKTDKAWSCFGGYTEPLQDVKDLSHELERELAAVTEQRDGLRAGIDYATDQLTKVTEQRDRLAEALEALERTSGLPALQDDPARVRARKVLQSLTTPTQAEQTKL